MNKKLTMQEMLWLSMREYAVQCMNTLLTLDNQLVLAKELTTDKCEVWKNQKPQFIRHKDITRFLANNTNFFAKTESRLSEHEYRVVMYYENNAKWEFRIIVHKEGNLILENHTKKPV